MVGSLANGMLAMLVAKFILNDVPHAIGLHNTSSGWVEDAWNKLLDYCDSRSIPLRSAAESDLTGATETRFEPMTPEAFQGYKKVMGGYYLIAVGRAPDYVVDIVYNDLKRLLSATRKSLERIGHLPLEEYVKVLREEEGVPIDRPVVGAPVGRGLLGAAERVLWIEPFFKNGNRVDKVIAIDAVVHLTHERGSYLGVLIGMDFMEGKLDTYTIDVVEALAK